MGIDILVNQYFIALTQGISIEKIIKFFED